MGQWSSVAEASVACRTDTAIAAGLGNHLPIGDYSGADYRSAVRFPVPAGWSGWTSITSASLSFYISDHQHVAPKNSSIYVSRMNITTPIWSKGAGSQNCESGFAGSNNTQADDITNPSTDRVSFSSGSTANAKKSVDVTAAMRYYWQNGAGASKPVFVFDNNGSGQYTELWSAQKTGGYDLVLTINYTDQEPPTAPTINSPDGGTVVVSQNPTLNFTPHDPQGDAHTEYHYQVAVDAGFAGLVEDLAVGGSFPDNTAISRAMVNAQARGATRYWRVQTRDAAIGYGPWSPTASFVVKADPVVSIDATRYMDFNGAPRLRVKWSVTGGTQVSYRVTGPSGYTSGIINNGNQDHLLDSLAISDNAAVSITVEVWTSDGLYNYASRSFTPRYGLTVHRRDLGATPLNWGGSTEQKTVPAGCQLIVEYGSSDTATAAPTGGWQASLGSVVKRRYVFWRAWFIPSATQGPTLDSINILSDTTTGKSIDKWRNWYDTPFGAPWAVDESEYVYGTRSVRLDCNGVWTGLGSAVISVKPGRSYILTGLMKSKGNSGATIQLVANGAVAKDETGALIQTDTLDKDTPWFSETSQDVNRYKTPVWKATTDTVYVLVMGAGAAGTQAWFDAIKLEESTVATPWSPASIGATVIDAGGVQIDGSKGGILRYKGTAGGARDVVEGGPKGLMFGGDTELYSDASAQLKTGGHLTVAGTVTAGWGVSSADGVLGPYHLAGSGNVLRIGGDGSSGGKWARIAHGSIDAQYWNQSLHGFIQGRYGTYEVAMSIAADAGVAAVETPVGVTTRTLFDGMGRSLVAKITIAARGASIVWHLWVQALGAWETYEWHPTGSYEEGNGFTIDNPATLGWIANTDPYGGVNYLSSAYTHYFGGGLRAAGNMMADGYMQAAGYMNAGGGIYESGVRLIQPAGQRIQSGAAAPIGNGTALTAVLAITFPVAFSGVPRVIPISLNAWQNAALSGLPTASGCGLQISDNRGSAFTNGVGVNMQWVAIGPA